MNGTTVSMCIALAAALAATSPELLAQRAGGSHGGGMGGGMGGGFGSGMSSGVQRGGAMGSPASERAGAPSNAGRHMGGEQQTQGGSAKTPADLLKQNTRLSERVAKLLPEGTDVQSAAAGFRNLGEFVAAVHVSHNLGIAFADLKAKITAGDSLGDAIHALRPSTDAQVEARKARAAAENEISKS